MDLRRRRDGAQTCHWYVNVPLGWGRHCKHWKVSILDKLSEMSNSRFSVLNNIVFLSRRHHMTEKPCRRNIQINKENTELKKKFTWDHHNYLIECKTVLYSFDEVSTSLPGDILVDGLSPAHVSSNRKVKFRNTFDHSFSVNVFFSR